LYDAASNRIDYNIHAGDLLFSVNKFSRTSKTRGRQMSKKAYTSQQPIVSSSLNGLQATRQELTKLNLPRPLTEPEVSEIAKKRLASEAITVLGVSRKPYTFLNDGQNQLDDPTVVVSGYTELHLNGDKRAPIGSLLYYDLPLNSDKQYHNDQQGKSFTCKKLRLLPLEDSSARITVDKIMDWFKEMGISTTAATDVQKAEIAKLEGDWGVVQEYLFGLYQAEEKAIPLTATALPEHVKKPLTSLLDTMKTIIAMPDRSMKERAMTVFEDIQFAPQRPMLGLQQKVVARTMRAGGPGDRVDALLIH
jgi:hypothetical protein